MSEDLEWIAKTIRALRPANWDDHDYEAIRAAGQEFAAGVIDAVANVMSGGTEHEPGPKPLAAALLDLAEDALMERVRASSEEVAP